jgi:hypothetical protein
VGQVLRHLGEMVGALCPDCCAGGALYPAGYRLLRGAGPVAQLFQRSPGAPLAALYRDRGFLAVMGAAWRCRLPR